MAGLTSMPKGRRRSARLSRHISRSSWPDWRSTSRSLARARQRILELGGIQAANSYVKINLSLFDMYPRQYCPSIPPEVMFLPGNFIYQMSAWTRAIVVSLAIVHSSNPRRPVPAGFNLDELYKPGVSLAFQPSERFFSWRNFFLSVDRFLKFWERHGSHWLRRKALRSRREMDAGTVREFRWPGRDLSTHDVRHHGAGCTGLPGGSPGQPGGALPIRPADDRRWPALSVPALLLADLGYGYRGVCIGPGRWRRPSR